MSDRRRARSLAVLVALAALAGSCSDDGGSGQTDPAGPKAGSAGAPTASATPASSGATTPGTVISFPEINFSLRLPDDWIALRTDREGYATDIVKLREEAPAAAAALDRYDSGLGETLAIRSVAVRRDGLATFTLTTISAGLEGEGDLADLAARGDEQTRAVGGRVDSRPERLDGMPAYFATADMPAMVYGKPYPPHSVSYLVSTSEAVVQLTITGSIPDAQDLLRQANFHS